MNLLRQVGVWTQIAIGAWNERRDDQGGVADEAALLAVLVGGAIAIGTLVLALLSRAEIKLNQVLPG
jgi:hypothetical protein